MLIDVVVAVDGDNDDVVDGDNDDVFDDNAHDDDDTTAIGIHSFSMITGDARLPVSRHPLPHAPADIPDVV